MITDERHVELNNLMSPVMNYFSLLQQLVKAEPEHIKAICRIMLEEEKVVHGVLPRIKDILNDSSAKICSDGNDPTLGVISVNSPDCTDA